MLSIFSYLGLLIGYKLGTAFGALLMLGSLLFFLIAFFLLFTFPPIFWFEVIQRGKALVVEKRDMLKAMTWGLLSPLPVLVIVFGLDLIYMAITGSGIHEYVDTAVTAPLIEELCKAAGLALLVKRIRNPYDGFILGFCAGAGFAMCENLLYFTSVAGAGFSAGLVTGFTDWTFVAIVRTVMAVESHALGTSLVGFGIGYYIEGKRRGSGFPPAILFGYMGAVALHAAWNGSIIVLDAVLPHVLGDGILSSVFTIVFIICFFLMELFILLKVRRRSQFLEDASLKRPKVKARPRPSPRPA